MKHLKDDLYHEKNVKGGFEDEVKQLRKRQSDKRKASDYTNYYRYCAYSMSNSTTPTRGLAVDAISEYP